MSTIRCVYTEEPQFPATDQHPDAVRYRVGPYFVDAIGGEPTSVEVAVVLGQDPRTIILQQLAAIDAATLAAARGLREFILGVLTWAGAAKQADPDLPDIPQNVGTQKLEQLEQAAIALRAQLAALG